MTQLIAYYFAAIFALATFAVYSGALIFAGMRLQRMLARRALMQRLRGLKDYAQAAKVPQPTPSAETRRGMQA